ncbi:MAG: CHRD domain-containing protein [Acidobacteriia bacterium]|nr:CHRD domain-containing protein [Terriglobia bacterium]
MRTTTISCAGLVLLCTSGLMAATAETIPFLTLMQPANEVPAITDTSLGNVIIWVHVIRDSSGNITSGSVDFDVACKFSGAVTVTGLHIHSAAAGVAGPIVIPTNVDATTNSIAVDATGRTSVLKQVQFPQTTPALPVSIVQDLIANPQNYYANIHTTDHPGGAMRGQLVRAEMRVLMAMMSPNNEVPPTGVNASGIATVTALRALDSSGNVAFAEAIFHLEYTGVDAASGTTFTGFHIHNGGAGINGPVIINTGIGGGANSVAADPSGTGNLTYEVPVAPTDASFATEVGTINGLFTAPANYYINIHTTVFGGGVMRDQLKTTDQAVFQVNMSSANETPAITGPAASAQTAIPIYLLRNADGTVAAGTVIFDVNFRGFPAATTITGLHIHQAAAGANGSIVLPTDVNGAANKVVTDTGNGNIFKIVTIATTTGITALNQLVKDPSGFYVNLHTTVNPSGAMRDQLAAVPAKPAVSGAAATSSTVTTTAPGAILSIYGTGLATYTSDLNGFNQATQLATSMNGVTATIGGLKAPIYFVSPGQLNVQVPFEVASGTQPIVVTSAGGASPATTEANVTIASVAPSIFIVDQTNSLGAVVKNSDFSLITPSNPVKAGDVIVVFSTGLGQTTPPAQTGVLLQPPAGGFNNTGTVSATIGGQTAAVVYSIASPGFAGLYQTAVTVPAGVSGTAKMALSAGGTASNTVNLAVQ